MEWASPLDLRKAGWTRDALKVGDSVTVEGWLARDGSKLASGRTIVLASGKKLAEAPETSSRSETGTGETYAALARWPSALGRRAR